MNWDFVPVIKKICGVAIKITAFVQSSIKPLLNIAFYQKKPLYALLNSPALCSCTRTRLCGRATALHPGDVQVHHRVTTHIVR